MARIKKIPLPPGVDVWDQAQVDAVLPPETPPEPRFCESCRFWRRADRQDKVADGQENAGVCLFDTPRSQVFLIPAPMPAGKIQVGAQQGAAMMPMSYRPQTSAGDFCSHHCREGELTEFEGLSSCLAEMIDILDEISQNLSAAANAPPR